MRSKYEEAEQRLEEVRGVLESLARSVESVGALADAARKQIDDLLVLTQDEIRKSTAERDRQQAEMQNSYKKRTERGAVDSFLISTIIAMIIAMVALFSSLLFFKRDLADDIIEHRFLLELLSMGFMILTIIILGTARLLTIESLAALIGSIAGYIFGGKTGGEDEEPATASVPATDVEAT